MNKIILLACFLTAATILAESPPLPEKLLISKTIYLVNDKMPNKAFDQVYTEFKKWGRFEVVADRKLADLIGTLTMRIENLGPFPTRETFLTLTDGSGESVFTETTAANPGRVVKNLRDKITKAGEGKNK